MSQDFLSQVEVDLLLKGVTGEDDFINEDDWVNAMSGADAEALKLERKVRYPEDGEKLTREEMIKILRAKVDECQKRIECLHSQQHAYWYALELLGSAE
jgi:hypothetical protein